MVAEKDYIEIPLGGKKFPGRVALIDPEDAGLVMKASWTAVVTDSNRERPDDFRLVEYASGFNKKNQYSGFPRRLYLHRLVMGVTDRTVQIDHINHNGLDCRKANLRTSSQRENVYNRRPQLNTSSKYKGVSWRTSAMRWRASIREDGAFKYLGEFSSEIDAAIAYDNAAMELFGEFAYLNFPERKAS